MTNFNSLSTAKLQKVASTEAQSFIPPPTWRNGRMKRRAFAVDAEYSLDRDDAISVTAPDEGPVTLHVSVADIGSFVDVLPAVTTLAERRLYTKYQNSTIITPMIPRVLSNEKLSLRHQQERPAITLHIPIDTNGDIGKLAITREIIVADNLTPAEVNAIPAIDRPDARTPFHDLGRIARLLYARRHGGDQHYEIEDDEGRVVPSQEFDNARFIVQECMIMANIAIGQFFVAHQIPAAFRIHSLRPEMILRFGDTTLPRNLQKHFARAAYSNTPGPHLGLGSDTVAHFTSPLRRFFDFINHCNLAAHLDGQEPFFTHDRIGKICDWANYLKKSTTSLLSRENKITHFQQKLQKETPLKNDFAHIFFGPIPGDPAAIFALRQEAFALLIDKNVAAREIVRIAFDKGFDVGNDYEFVSDKKQATPIKCLEILSKQAGLELSHDEIKQMVRRVAIIKNGRNFINSLSIELRIPIKEHTVQNEEGGYTSTFSMRIRGEERVCTANAPDPEEAQQRAIGLFISENDLINNPLHSDQSRRVAQKEVRRLHRLILENPQAHPQIQLKIYTDKNHTPITTRLTTEDDEQGQLRTKCHMVVIDNNGQPHEATAYASNKKDATLLAAHQLVGELGLKKKTPARRPKRS